MTGVVKKVLIHYRPTYNHNQNVFSTSVNRKKISGKTGLHQNSA